MKPKQLTEMSDEEVLLQENMNLIATGLFACQTEEQVDLAVSFARYLSSNGLTRSNYSLFLRLIASNNHWVVDSLIGERQARLMFASIPPSTSLIKDAFSVLSFFHSDIIYQKTLEAALGVIQMAYYDPDDGYNIYKLRISDINTLGKYLEKDKEQGQPINALVLEILDRLSGIGDYNKVPAKNVLARHSFYVRIAYFDHRKNLEDVIPQVLLYNASRRKVVTNPSQIYREALKREQAGSAKVKAGTAGTKED